MKFKIVKKETGIRSIHRINNYIEIRKFNYIIIQQEDKRVLENRFDNKFAKVLNIKDKKIIIADYPKIKTFDLLTGNIVQQVNIQVKTQSGTYKVIENKLLLVEKENPDDLAILLFKNINDSKIIWELNSISIDISEIHAWNDILIFVDVKNQILQTIDINLGIVKWQFDISQFGTYKVRDYIKKVYEERQREIKRVYYHNNKIIVTLSRAIIALNPDDGELIWKIDFENYNPIDLLFDGNIAYSGTLIYFAIIDIERGIKLFEKDFDPSYRFEVSGYKLSQIRYIGLTLHNNFLWFTHEDKGHQFLLKAKPENGDIVDGMLLETRYSTDAPIFDGSRMYILDQEGNLYVYEEE